MIFKQRHSPESPGYVPGTPKLTALRLPEETGESTSRPLTRAGTRPPQTPVMAEPTSSRSHPTAGQPAKPLKSILKGRTAPPRQSYDSESEILTSKNVVRSGTYGVPNPLPPGARLGPMKPPAVDLHWQLLPYDPRRSKRLLRFDMAFPVDSVCFQEQGYRSKLTNADLDKAAANDPLTKMLITFERGDFTWEVDVKRAQGIRCRDIFQAIYNNFNEQLTPYEKRLIPRHKYAAIQEAFRLRCKLAAGLSEVELALGWKRVDVLEHGTIFLGLTQPKSGGDWVLNLGRPIF